MFFHPLSFSSLSFNSPYLPPLCFAPSYPLSLPRPRALLHSFTFVSLITSLYFFLHSLSFLDTSLILSLPVSSLISSSSLFHSPFFHQLAPSSPFLFLLIRPRCFFPSPFFPYPSSFFSFPHFFSASFLFPCTYSFHCFLLSLLP